MTIEVKAPTFPESVADGTIATWHKQPGEPVARDELIVDIETDKVVLEVVALSDGTVKEIYKQEGDTVLSGEVIGLFEEGVASAQPAVATSAASTGAPVPATAAPQPVENLSASAPSITAPASTAVERPAASINPSAHKMIEEQGLNAGTITPTGKDGRITKEDVINHVKGGSAASGTTSSTSLHTSSAGRLEKRVPMTRLRQTIAKRLLEAQQQAAMLTTYNEVNMQPIMNLRSTYKTQFEKIHGIKLGFMSFFVKAATEALKRFPSVNASIDDSDIVYHGYQDIGVAVSTERGLVVPILRDTDSLGLSDIEKTIVSFGERARDGKLGLEDMKGGTFTISNGGVFGSLMSTPILNPPQTAIMGMHKIQERPMAVNGEVKILPMMYLALSYDHRMIDGKEAVQFLVTIKDLLEDPARMLLDV